MSGALSGLSSITAEMVATLCDVNSIDPVGLAGELIDLRR
jgi:hypothetical protein